jgi:hypothetical protein
MIIPKLFIAMSYLDDDLIVAAIDYNPSLKSRVFKPWHGFIAACFCLAFISVFVITISVFNNPSPLGKTQFKTNSLSEIEALFDSDLLLGQIKMPGSYESEYILETTTEGSFYDSNNWKSLSASLYNDSEGNFHTNGDYINCLIIFDGDTSSLDKTIWSKQFFTSTADQSAFYTERTSEEIDALNLTNEFKQNYRGYAQFDYLGNKYYISTASNDPEFFDKTIKNKLIYGSMFDLETENSDYLITGPGVPFLPSDDPTPDTP